MTAPRYLSADFFHSRIVTTILEGDQDVAREAVSEHIRTGFSRIEASYLQAFPDGQGLDGRDSHEEGGRL